MQVVIIYESLTGNTRAAAQLISDAFFERQGAGQALRGGWLRPGRGRRGRPGHRGQLDRRPLLRRPEAGQRKKFTGFGDLSGKRAAVFCTYAVDPGKTLDKFTRLLADQGADVIGGMAIRRNELAEGAEEFVARVMQSVSV